MSAKRSIKDFFSTTIKKARLSQSPTHVVENNDDLVADNHREKENNEEEDVGNQEIEREPFSQSEDQEENSGSETEIQTIEDDEHEQAKISNISHSQWSSFPFPADISKNPHESPSQPVLKQYPLIKIGDRYRTFKSDWYKKFAWLEFSVIANKAFCFYCRFFSKSDVKEKSFIMGYNNWKKALYSDAGFQSHNNSITHKECEVKYKSFKQASLNKSLPEMLTNHNSKVIEENKHYIKTLAEILLLTCKLEIAQRGHDESKDSVNKGNFLELVDAFSKRDPLFKKKLMETGGNAKYLHSSIQNELLEILGNEVLKTVRDEVNDTGFYAVLADETKDVSKKEQVSIIVRYLHNSEIKDAFLGFVHADKLNAESLTGIIKDTLLTHGLKLENCVAQAYDGASVMSGNLSGVQSRFKQEVPHAIYVHCYNHVLNLAIVDCCKGIPEFLNFFNMAENLYNFMSNSTVHTEFISVQKKIWPKRQPKELKKLQHTRWSIQHRMCNVLEQTFEAVVCTLHIFATRNTDRGLDAKGLLQNLNKTFLVYMISFKEILGVLSKLSDYLQSRDLDYFQANALVEEVINQLSHMREDNNSWQNIWEKVEEMSKETGIATKENIVEKRKRSLPARFKEFFTELQAEDNWQEIENDLKVRCFFTALDRILSELRSRFSDNKVHFSGLSALQPGHKNFLNITDLLKLASNYELHCPKWDEETLRAECLLLKRMLDRDENRNIKSMLELCNLLQSYYPAFENLLILIKVGLTLPVSTACCERSFSCLKRVKTYLRSSMVNSRLTHISILSIEKNRAKNIDLDKVVFEFGRNHNNRRILLSL